MQVGVYLDEQIPFERAYYPRVFERGRIHFLTSATPLGVEIDEQELAGRLRLPDG